MTAPLFDLQSEFSPAGDQPEAIAQLTWWFTADNMTSQVLLGATGTGKTFTMAHLIQNLNKPTLILSHNKTLAAQLATEFKHFFPKNAVHYFVSYFDYYQPESYLPDSGTYIEKEATINDEIEMYRLSTLASLLSRKDVIVVASVSSLYGLGARDAFYSNTLKFVVWNDYDFKDVKARLLAMQYKPVHSKIEQGMFELKGETLDIYSSIEKKLYRLIFDEDRLEHIIVKDPLSFRDMGMVDNITIWPSTQYVQDMSDIENILTRMQAELDETVPAMEKAGNALEAQRLRKRVEYDIRMIRETWFTNGIENYSLYFDKRIPGQPPTTLFDYFPDDMTLIIDESHMTIGQLKAMPKADKSRKLNLVNHGFRLPSAIDHRPLNFAELEAIMWWEDVQEATPKLASTAQEYFESRLWHTHQEMLASHTKSLLQSYKPWSKTLFVSATPAAYEIGIGEAVVQQVIRPTWLLDPITYVYPKSGDYQTLVSSVDTLIKKKPHVKTYFNGFDQEDISTAT